MIELYNNAGTESYGSFDKLKSAGGVLATLASRGVKSVTVSSFHGQRLVPGISRAHGRGLPYHQNADTAADADNGGIA